MPPRTLDELITDAEIVSDSWEHMRALREDRLPSPMEEQQASIDRGREQMARDVSNIEAHRPTNQNATSTIEPTPLSREQRNAIRYDPFSRTVVAFDGYDENGNIQTRPVTPEQDPEYFVSITNRSHVHVNPPNPLRTFDYTSNINPYVYYGDNTIRTTPLEQPTPRVEPNYTNIVRQRGQNTLITYTNTWGGSSVKKGLRSIPMFNDLRVDGSNRTKLNSKVRVTWAREDDVVLDLLVKQLKIDETTPVQTEFAF